MINNKKNKILCCLISLAILIECYTSLFQTFISSNKLPFVTLGYEKAQPKTVEGHRRFAVFGCSTPGEYTHRGFDYTFYLPLSVAAWRRIGFESIVLIIGDKIEWKINPVLSYVIDFLDKFTNATILFIPAKVENRIMLSQTARIFVANLESFPGSLSDDIITTDSDLWPLRADHFNQPKGFSCPVMLVHSKCCGKFNFGGRSYTMIPMSHIRASAATWKEIINVNLSVVANDSDTILDYFRNTFGESVHLPVEFASDDWYLDQRLVSIRIDEWVSRQPSKDVSVYEISDAGFYRIDRSSWNAGNIQQSSFNKYFDSHLPLNGFIPETWNTVQPLLRNMYGENSTQYKLFNRYASEFFDIFMFFYGSPST
jgi:hypothetical protein